MLFRVPDKVDLRQGLGAPLVKGVNDHHHLVSPLCCLGGRQRGRHPATRRGGRLGAPVLLAATEVELDVLPVGGWEGPAAHLLQQALEVALIPMSE